jgi:hypothetical protein
MYYGWLEDAIWALAKDKCEGLRRFPYCLITCVDSNPDVKFMDGIFTRETSCSVYGNGLLVRDAQIVEIGERYNLFNPFDEMWLFENPPTQEKPDTFSIVAPLDLNKDPLPQGLLEWFNASGCVLGLGDGIGLNYVTANKSIFDALLERQKSPRSVPTITIIKGPAPP